MSNTADVSSPSRVGFDPDALRAKYREERDRRLRPDGNEQYVEAKGDFSRCVDDPYVEPGFTREPLTDTVEVVIIGGGLLAGARLRESGVKEIRIIEKGGDFGGTWYWNRYPGAQCDIEASSICRCSMRPATSRRRSTPSLRRYWPTPAALARNSICIVRPAFRPRSDRLLGRGRVQEDRHDEPR